MLLLIAAAGFVLTCWSATATKVIQECSRRELELFCQRRQRLELFSEILDEDENVMIGSEILQLVGSVLLVVSGSLCYFQDIGDLSRFSWWQFGAGVALATVLLVAVVTWVPWAVVRLWAAPFLFHTWRPLRAVTRLLWPLSLGVAVFDALLRRLANRPESDEDEEEAFEDEIRSIVTEGLHDGLLEEDAREMIEGVIELGDTDVHDIMTPRANVNALDISLSWPEILVFVVEVGRTRIPVYEKSLDNIIGVLFVKDLLPELSRKPDEPHTQLRELLRDPWFVPTTKPLDEMLQEFRQTRRHLAIVVDEYQSVAGVVTIEDILEEIVGEIVDEFDKEELNEVIALSDNKAEVLGTAHLDLVNERLAVDLPDPDEYDTLAGLVIRKLGRIPKTGETVQVDGIQITVVEATRRRVDKLLVEVDRP
jgi:CBS domain containing-hemolysin-like protein